MTYRLKEFIRSFLATRLLTQISNFVLRLKMFSGLLKNWIRDWKISKNHRIRVSSIVLRDNDEIVRKMDEMKVKYFEAERKEDKESTVRYKSIFETLEWLINEPK